MTTGCRARWGGLVDGRGVGSRIAVAAHIHIIMHGEY